ASEEAHREPAESVVYFRSGMVLRSFHQLRRLKAKIITKSTLFYYIRAETMRSFPLISWMISTVLLGKVVVRRDATAGPCSWPISNAVTLFSFITFGIALIMF